MTANVTNKTIGTTNISRLLVQSDSKADTIYFYLTKMYDGVDISAYTWYIAYANEYGEGDAELVAKTLSTSTFTLSWQPSGWATARSGRLKIVLYGMDGETTKWQTFPAYVNVVATVDPTTPGGYTYTVLDQYLVLFEAARDRAEAAADSAEEDLATFQSIWLGVLDADPVATVNGAIYFNSNTTRLRIYELATETWHDYGTDADEIDYTPSGQLEATNVQDAVDELEAEKVPYSGATADVDLGAHSLALNAMHLSTTPPGVIPTTVGSVYWDTDALTWSIVLPDGVVLQVGEENYILVKNTTGSTIVNGTPVYVIGESGQRPTIGIARADDAAKIKVTGLTTQNIGTNGRITTCGLVRAISLSVKPAGETWTAGNYLWLAPTGGMTNVEPSAPTPNVRLGLILNVTGSTSFDMLVYIRPAHALYDAYDVNGSAPNDKDALVYDTALGYWKASNRITTLEADVSTTGSVLKSIKDNAKDATFTPTGDIEATTLATAIAEVDSEKVAKTSIADNLTTDDATKVLSAKQGKALQDGKVDKSVIKTSVSAIPLDTNVLSEKYIVDNLATQSLVSTNRLYSDSQYLELKAKADALQIKCNTLQAETYTDDPILQFGATEIIGDGYESDYSAIDVSATVQDGKLEMEQKGLTIRNIVDGASIADDGTVTFATILNEKYYDTLNAEILTGTGSDMTAANESGATANMAIYHLNAHGLQAITSTAILSQLLPYVDGTKNVGKMGVLVRGVNQCPTDTGSWEQGLIDTSTGADSASTTNIRTKAGVYYPILASSVMSFSQLTGYTLYALFYDSARAFISSDSGTNKTVPATAKYVRWRLYHASTLITPSSVNTLLPMANLGSTSLPYTPYSAQHIFLPAIGNRVPNGVADSVLTVADGWERTKRVERRTDIHTLTTWSMGQEGDNTIRFNKTIPNLATPTYITDDAILIIGNMWFNRLASTASPVDVEGFTHTGNQVYIRIAKSKLSAVSSAGFEAWMQAQGSSIYDYQLATPTTTKYPLPLPTSGKTIHRFAGEEKISLYGTGLVFDENVLSVISAFKFVAGVMSDITSLAVISGTGVTFSTAPNATDVVFVRVEHSVNRPLGVLEHVPAVSNTASRLASLESFFTPEGGIAIWLTNGTGATSVKGSVVSMSTATDNQFILQANEFDSVGVVYDAGIANGGLCRVVIQGVAQVLLKDGQTTTRGYVAIAADTDGRMVNVAVPSSNPVVAEHFKEIGHVMESKSSGTNVLVKCVLHFN